MKRRKGAGQRCPAPFACGRDGDAGDPYGCHGDGLATQSKHGATRRTRRERPARPLVTRPRAAASPRAADPAAVRPARRSSGSRSSSRRPWPAGPSAPPAAASPTASGHQGVQLVVRKGLRQILGEHLALLAHAVDPCRRRRRRRRPVHGPGGRWCPGRSPRLLRRTPRPVGPGGGRRVPVRPRWGSYGRRGRRPGGIRGRGRLESGAFVRSYVGWAVGCAWATRGVGRADRRRGGRGPWGRALWGQGAVGACVVGAGGRGGVRCGGRGPWGRALWGSGVRRRADPWADA
ncbi:hypothetical protein SANTM175S_05799 [Streptomyces antimycoticus]